jgi:hypothetical protein
MALAGLDDHCQVLDILDESPGGTHTSRGSAARLTSCGG